MYFNNKTNKIYIYIYIYMTKSARLAQKRGGGKFGKFGDWVAGFILFLCAVVILGGAGIIAVGAFQRVNWGDVWPTLRGIVGGVVLFGVLVGLSGPGGGGDG